MTVTVPTVVLVLPIIAAVAVAHFLLCWRAWERWIDPALRRWFQRRYGPLPGPVHGDET